MNFEAKMEQSLNYTGTPWLGELGNKIGGSDPLSFEMHLDAVI